MHSRYFMPLPEVYAKVLTVYKRNPFTLTLILLIIMAVMVYFCEPLMACQAQGKSDTGASDTGDSQSAGATGGNASIDAGAGSSDVGNSAQSSKGGESSQHGVAQMDNGGHEGNGGESVPLIDCSNPWADGLWPCRRGK